MRLHPLRRPAARRSAAVMRPTTKPEHCGRSERSTKRTGLISSPKALLCYARQAVASDRHVAALLAMARGRNAGAFGINRSGVSLDLLVLAPALSGAEGNQNERTDTAEEQPFAGCLRFHIKSGSVVVLRPPGNRLRSPRRCAPRDDEGKGCSRTWYQNRSHLGSSRGLVPAQRRRLGREAAGLESSPIARPYTASAP